MVDAEGIWVRSLGFDSKAVTCPHTGLIQDLLYLAPMIEKIFPVGTDIDETHIVANTTKTVDVSLTIDGDIEEMQERLFDQTIRVTIICYTKEYALLVKSFTSFNLKGDIEPDMPVATEDYKYYAQMIAIAEHDAIIAFQDFARKEQAEVPLISIRTYDRILTDVKANKFKLNK